MSLTTILDYHNSNFKDFRTLLSELFPKPKIKLEESVIINPRTKNYGPVGGAFDYLLRFHLEKRFPQNSESKEWIAEHAIKRYFHPQKEANYINRFTECKEVYQKFLVSALEDEITLIKASLYLAKLDAVFRKGPIMKIFLGETDEDSKDIDDLNKLITSTDLDAFQPSKKLVLNPTFGKGSKLVGGADADLIIDDLLVDVKVKNELSLTRGDLNQILCYYLLYLFGGVAGHDDVKLNRIGIYFARYGCLWTTEVACLADAQTFQRAINFLEKRLTLPS